MLNFHALTIFPKIFDSYITESIIKRAIKKNLISFTAHDLRNFAINDYGQVDDKPFGGGPGMIMMIKPIYKALENINSQFTIHDSSSYKQSPENQQTNKQAIDKISKHNNPEKIKTANYKPHTILLSASGKSFTQKKAKELSQKKNIIFICGRYEGIDARVAENLIDEKISIGNYVLTGGELPAMVLIDAITRLIPGVLGNKESSKDESFYDGKTLEYPQYTRPANFNNWQVPKILLSGDHKKIKKWKENNKR